MRALALVLSFLLCPTVFAQSTPAVIVGQAFSPTIGQGTVTGRVILADTRAPARGARVLLMPLGDNLSERSSQSLSCGTALDGTYTLAHVLPGEYVVAAIAPGYLSLLDGLLVQTEGGDQKAANAQLREAGNPIRISGTSTARQDLELLRGATFSGKVTYSDGQPSAQSKIVLEKVKDSAAKDDTRVDGGALLRTMLQLQQPRTDDLGNFRIAGVAPGKYRLVVVQASQTASLMDDMVSAMEGRTQNTSLTIYSPGKLHSKDATIYEVGPGDLRDGLQIILPLGGLHQVSGRVRGKEGAQVDTARLLLTDTADPAIQFTAHVASGEFLFAGVPEGTYELKVSNGRTYETLLIGVDDEQVDRMEDIGQYMGATHAFAAASRAVIVKDADVESIDFELDETALPKPPSRAIPRPPPPPR